MILTINAGSSSVRLAAFARTNTKFQRVADASLTTDRGDAREVLEEFCHLHDIQNVVAVSHRVVHGGALFEQSTVVDSRVERAIEELASLAPLHNPRALRWLRAARLLFAPSIPQVAVFDTAYFVSLPPVARHYALPSELAERHAIQRYGFHGIAHRYLWHRYAELDPHAGPQTRLISLQLGSGCSITATLGGTAQDTSMGFSPLEGLVMATRSGDMDPSIVTFLQRTENWDAEQMDDLLNHRSGLLGVSGISNDMRELLESDRPEARLAIELFCYRARKYIGAYATVLGGVDAIAFGGGVGENAPAIRHKILQGMEWLGIDVDKTANEHARGSEARIHVSDSKVQLWVLPVEEAEILAREAWNVIAS